MVDKKHFIVVGSDGNATAHIFEIKCGLISETLSKGQSSSITARGMKVRVGRMIKETDTVVYWRVKNKGKQLKCLKESKQTLTLSGENKTRVAKIVQSAKKIPQAAS